MAYFDARSKGLVQINNSKHFPIDQYLHDRMTPATLSPTPLAYEKPIHPTEMPCITTCTELSVDDTNKPTSDDKYPWLESDDIRRNMTDSEILRMKLNLKDSVLDEKGKEEFLANVEQFTCKVLLLLWLTIQWSVLFVVFVCIKLLGNVVRVYPKIVRGLTFLSA